MSFHYEDVEKIYNKVKKLKQKGKNAEYIPDLKKGNPNIYAISVCNMKGDIMNFGDYELDFESDMDILLSNGRSKKAKDITTEDDIDDNFLKNLRKNKK